MCTVSWLHQDGGGYHVLFNRDEQRTRKPASPPRLRLSEGVRYAAPEDGDFGGTWIATNEFGVTLCVLNGANLTGREAPRGPAPCSRGWIARRFIPATTASEVESLFQDANFMAFAAFTLVAIERGQTLVMEWDGAEKQAARAGVLSPLISSSFDPANVRGRRYERYGNVAGTGAGLESLVEFHAWHDGAPNAYSTCMHRPDAQTVSFSRISVQDSRTNFFYSPQAPCQGLNGETLTLRLHS